MGQREDDDELEWKTARRLHDMEHGNFMTHH